MVTDEMDEGAKGEDKKPGFPLPPMEVKSGEGNEKENDKGVGKYPAAAEGFSKEELTYGFINDVREE